MPGDALSFVLCVQNDWPLSVSVRTILSGYNFECKKKNVIGRVASEGDELHLPEEVVIGKSKRHILCKLTYIDRFKAIKTGWQAHVEWASIFNDAVDPFRYALPIRNAKGRILF